MNSFRRKLITEFRWIAFAPAALIVAIGFLSAHADESGASQINLVDYFLPMEPQGSLISEGIWGASNVLPRDIKNGLEDPTLENWCYWDGKIVKDDEGRCHIYASRWSQSFPHSTGWRQNSKGIHAISDKIMGPYVDKGLIWPKWNGGRGSNVIGLRMHDGRYAAVSSEITPGDVFVSSSPNGPFEYMGGIQVDYNGFDPGLARYQGGKGNMSNVKILLRSDGRYMIVARSTAVMISEDGILGPYKILSDRIYKNYPELPQEKNEDPTVWYSGGLYHIVYNHWPSRTSYHFSSTDGITDWKYRGIAFKKGESKIFRYTDGTVNDWEFIERPTAYVEDGHVTHFIFSVLDVHKGSDLGGDHHASKIVVVPFDGKSFDRDMQKLVEKEKRGLTQADWDGVPIPIQPDPGEKGELQAVSDSGERALGSTDLAPVRAGEYVHIYAPEGDVFPGPDTVELAGGRRYEKWVPNDHCFIQGPDERWHMFGITHPLTSFERVHEGEYQSFHARSPKGPFEQGMKEGAWEDRAKVLSSPERPGEPLANHAPYVVKKDGVFYMFYGPTPIRYATSKDLYKWTPRGPVENAPEGRDPSVLQWRDMYYMATCGDGQVRLAASKDLIHWGDHRVILRMKEGVDPESPSIVRHGGYFYLFVCGWNGVWDKKNLAGAYQHVTHVYRSDALFAFEFEAARLDAHAPEVFQDEKGNWYVSSVEWPNRGVSVARLEWGDSSLR